ncbi:hypothetical protein LTR37_009734 [Vermiconidia calcicola]|uniref:Uncharacterized protein n=1 Tax=Vermiconidia calcicola TaxID=1690605 RepID=A0ACC3N8B2_9PEZI|nr:hypothetical protein LTR37_009734 [Vermiconidia calcicola]
MTLENWGELAVQNLEVPEANRFAEVHQVLGQRLVERSRVEAEYAGIGDDQVEMDKLMYKRDREREGEDEDGPNRKKTESSTMFEHKSALREGCDM